MRNINPKIEYRSNSLANPSTSINGSRMLGKRLPIVRAMNATSQPIVAPILKYLRL